MHLVDIILDNRVSCKFINDRESENIIFCRPLEECLHNINLITTKDDEFVHSYIEESTGNYIVTPVTLPDGTVHDDIRFKIIECEVGADLPHCIINLETLGTFPDSKNVLLTEDTSAIYERARGLETNFHKETQKLNEERLALEKEKDELRRKQLVLEEASRSQKTLEDYKADLLQEAFLVGIQQRDLLEKTISELTNNLQEQFDSQQINVGKYLDTILANNLNELKEQQNKKLDTIREDINRLIDEKIALKLRDNTITSLVSSLPEH